MKKHIQTISVLLCVLFTAVFFSACGSSKKSNGSDNPTSTSAVSSDSSNIASGITDSTSDGTDGVDITSSTGTISAETPSSGAGGEQESTVSQPADSTAPTVFLSAEKNGSTVTVTANIKNNPGIIAFQFGITYNKEAVTPKSLQNGLISVTSNLQQGKDCNGSVTAVYIDTVGFSNNGTLFSVTFDIADSSKTAEFGIKSEANSFLDQSGNNYIAFQTYGTTAD